tara:strand:- start:230 stop:583 length:354 start_codon:yes stop_codon:yes gene_type:complete
MKKSNTLKSLQRKLINILTNVQTRTLGLEAAKEQISNLFGKYEEAEQIQTLDGTLTSAMAFITDKGLMQEAIVWMMDDADAKKVIRKKLDLAEKSGWVSDSDLEDFRNNDQTQTGQE